MDIYKKSLSFFLFLSFLLSGSLFANNNLYTQAKNENKLLVSIFSGAWCGRCKELKSELKKSFPNKEIIVAEIDRDKVRKISVSSKNQNCSPYYQNSTSLDAWDNFQVKLYKCLKNSLFLPEAFILDPSQDKILITSTNVAGKELFEEDEPTVINTDKINEFTYLDNSPTESFQGLVNLIKNHLSQQVLLEEIDLKSLKFRTGVRL